MTVSNEQVAIGKCNICGINVYDRGVKNKPFRTSMGKQAKGYPRDIAMPCGIDRSTGVLNPEMTKEQYARCPFETKEQQLQIEYKKGIGVISGANTWDAIV